MRDQINEVISLNDEGCRIVRGLHKDLWGRNTVVTIQHPMGIRFEVIIPENDDPFKPWMTEYVIYNSFDEDETKRSENENKTIEAFRNYAKEWIKTLRIGQGADEYEPCVAFSNFNEMTDGFFNGYMAVLTGEIKVL